MIKNRFNSRYVTIVTVLSTIGFGSIYASSSPKALEWRPKGSVQVPPTSYVLAGKTVSEKMKLWHTPLGFMLKGDKTSWRKIHPENCDEAARSMDRKRAAAFLMANGTFIVSKTEDGSYIIRGMVPGLGGGDIGEKIGKAIPWVAGAVWYYFAGARAVEAATEIPRTAIRTAGGSDAISDVGAMVGQAMVTYALGAFMPQVLPGLPPAIGNNRHFNGAVPLIISNLENRRQNQTFREVEAATTMVVAPALATNGLNFMWILSEACGLAGRVLIPF